jgi:hypothetical protein
MKRICIHISSEERLSKLLCMQPSKGFCVNTIFDTTTSSISVVDNGRINRMK